MVAYLDGELPLGSDVNVRRHVQSCWKCRLRLSEMEGCILQMTKLFTEEPLLDSGRIADARQKLDSRMRLAKAESGFAPRRNFLQIAWSRRIATAASLLLLAGIGAASFLILTPRLPKAASPLPARREMPSPRKPAVPVPVPAVHASPRPEVPVHAAPVGRALEMVQEPASLLMAELHAYYALHLAGSCRNELVEVVREPNGVEIRGVISTAARRERVQELVAETGDAARIAVHLQTIDEAIAQAPAAKVPEVPDGIVRQSKLPVEDLVIGRQSGTPGGAVDQRALAAASQEAVTRAEEAIAEAFALRKLAERFGKAPAGADDARVGPILAVMVKDHLTAMNQQIDLCNRAIAPVTNLAPPVVVPGKASGLSQPADAVAAKDWNQATEELFQDVLQWHSLVHGLFAGAGLGNLGPAEAAGLLAGSTPALENRTKLLEHEILTGLPSRRQTNAARRP